jgi:hypothetical protein
MKDCDHSHWLGLHTRDSHTTFTYSDRAQNLLQSLPSCDFQTPSLFVLIGNNRKSQALQELVSSSARSKSTSRQRHGEVHLRVDSSTIFSERPLIFADGDFPTFEKPSKCPAVEKCHESFSRTLPRLRDTVPATGLQKTADYLYLRLLSPFTDVFCFFAADLGGLRVIARRIAAWLDIGQPSTLPPATHPQIVIVMGATTPELQESLALDEFLNMLHEETRLDISTQFARVRILSLLRDRDVSSQARHRRLKECLMSASDQVRSARKKTRFLFSAQHFSAFLSLACLQFSGSPTQPFDFIQASRLDNPPALDLKYHLTNFLSKIRTPQELMSFAVPHIASSFLLDSYPPEMHRMLDLDSKS